jgi:serine/threonine protein phosphatase PrpC
MGNMSGAEGSELVSGGWTLYVATASGKVDDGQPADFHAVVRGEDFGNPARGVIAIVARANAPGRAALEAVQVAVHQFAEGVFSAPSTLSGGRAAERALAAVNAWLYAQPDNAQRTLSLSATILSNRRVGVVHVGLCAVWRWRAGELIRLTIPHVRRAEDERDVPSRAVGAEPHIRLDYVDLPVEPGDRFVLLSEGASRIREELGDLSAPAEEIANRLCRAARTGGAVFLEVRSLPEVSYDDLAAAFSKLPLRPAPKDGDVWDDFEISRTLYRSRWTILKLARDRVSGGAVVLKIPLPAMLHDSMFRSGFLREAWVGRLVASPWVSKPIDLPADRATSLYLVMPYYEGESLAERIARKPPLSIVESIDVVLKLCAGTQSLLNQQIVHRDIKPENVMLSSNGGVTLLDLGMAYLPAIDGPYAEGIGGSTHYMAPELFDGVTANARTEVFALAVTLYRMISGEYPFSGRDASPPPPMPERAPRWLRRVLLQAMSPIPQVRPASPAEFARLLEEGIVRGDAEPPDERRRWRKPSALVCWRIAAVVFAVALFGLLIHDLLVRR